MLEAGAAIGQRFAGLGQVIADVDQSLLYDDAAVDEALDPVELLGQDVDPLLAETDAFVQIVGLLLVEGGLFVGRLLRQRHRLLQLLARISQLSRRIVEVLSEIGLGEVGDDVANVYVVAGMEHDVADLPACRRRGVLDARRVEQDALAHHLARRFEHEAGDQRRDNHQRGRPQDEPGSRPHYRGGDVEPLGRGKPIDRLGAKQRLAALG